MARYWGQPLRKAEAQWAARRAAVEAALDYALDAITSIQPGDIDSAGQTVAALLAQARRLQPAARRRPTAGIGAVFEPAPQPALASGGLSPPTARVAWPEWTAGDTALRRNRGRLADALALGGWMLQSQLAGDAFRE